MKYCCKKVEGINKDVIIVSFAGFDKTFYEIPRFEFVNSLHNYFPNIAKHFYLDDHMNCYHNGISEISTNIDETVEYLKNELSSYKKIIFIGTSCGGYAAIMFGSLLNVTTVIAFLPQTIRYKPDNVNETYRDLRPHINNKTNYYIYGDPNITNMRSYHHFSHCERISDFKNVTVIKKIGMNIKEMSKNGELQTIINDAVESS